MILYRSILSQANENIYNNQINPYNSFVLYDNYDPTTHTHQRIIYNNGKLIVSGSGALAGDWSEHTLVEWTKVKDSCTSLTFTSGCTITEIGDYAFTGMSQLTNELKLPETVVKIGNYAFFHCGFTDDLVIPESMKEVGISAFNGCSELDSIDAEAAVEMEWGYGAFANCVGQYDLKLPVKDTGTDLDKIFKVYYVEDASGVYLIQPDNVTAGNTVLPNDKIYIGRIGDKELDERPYYDFHYLLTTGHTDTADNIRNLATISIPNVASVDESGCVTIDANCAKGSEFTVVVMDNFKGEPDFDVRDSGRYIHFTVGEKNKDFAGGLGTQERPYLIDDYADLSNIDNYPNAHYKLIDNIDCFGKDTLDAVKNYQGTFDGNGYTISNASWSNGMFVQNKGTIKNLTLSNVSVSCGGDCAGILVSDNQAPGKIYNCHITNNSVLNSSYYNNSADCLLFAGGIVTPK